MENKHTPGPWAVTPQPESDGGMNEIIRAAVSVVNLVGPEKAPAMIEAGPDMLEALELALAGMELSNRHVGGGLSVAISSARAAIAKARGTPQ